MPRVVEKQVPILTPQEIKGLRQTAAHYRNGSCCGGGGDVRERKRGAAVEGEGKERMTMTLSSILLERTHEPTRKVINPEK